MNRFGFVVVPEKGVNLTNVTGMAVENGIAATAAHDPGLPIAAWYTTVGGRDGEMDAYAKKYPGLTFAKVEITEGICYQPRATPARFAFSDKGKIPL